ncbi:chemotaxis protein [Limnoraphis robusta Tam1]|uniref:chemotaxis protein n=1 Tax=Limnoraphis robusta TaxID=1118279 RepID=UPI002B21F36A|nr:chemotaxis protein [Limnoraphis robusta]MEA5540828.1 chemotaxis protein [Limnoraphis robusta Tam1]
MSSSSRITLESTVEDLISHTFQVNSTTPGRVIAQEFHQNPELPGVIVVDDHQLVGMISKANFREQMNNLNRKNLYFNQPIQLLLDVIRIPPLVLSKNCTILFAANQALTRPKQFVYEPIIIELDQGEFRLLDIYNLLLAQNNLLNFSCRQIEQQNLKLQTFEQKLQQEKNKVIEYAASLKQEKDLIFKQYDKDYSKRKAKLAQYTQPILQFNQHFLRMSERISVETRKAFYAIFVGSNSIYRNTEHLFKISQAIADDLAAINSTSQMLGEIIQKVRHLAVQAAIVTYQSDSPQPQGFSQISLEINRLIRETSKVSDQTHTIANQLNFNLQELQESAIEDARITCSMLSHVEQAEAVLDELEKLVNSSNLQHQVTQQNSADAEFIIQTIERVLKYKQQPKN